MGNIKNCLYNLLVVQKLSREIINNKISYFTHGFFKYPCKFIPQIPKWAIQKYSKQGDYVLDPFAGSSTTLYEAKMLGRKYIGIEIHKEYVDISNKRLEGYLF